MSELFAIAAFNCWVGIVKISRNLVFELRKRVIFWIRVRSLMRKLVYLFVIIGFDFVDSLFEVHIAF